MVWEGEAEKGLNSRCRGRSEATEDAANRQLELSQYGMARYLMQHTNAQ